MSTNATNIERAKTQIIISHPFFASVLLKRDMEATTAVPTAGMLATGHIKYNPEWVAERTVGECVFLLAHECMHWMLMHCGKLRCGDRNPKKWNYACDAVINETLIAANVGDFIAGGVRWPGAENMTAEEIYNLLPPDEDGDGECGGPEPGGIGSDVDTETALDPAQQAQLETQVEVEISQAAEAAKQMGNMPGALKRMVEELLAHPVPWYEYLARFMQQRVASDYSWKRPNRRFIANDTYLPTLDGVAMGEMAIIIDTSGSIAARELAEFSGHLNVILDSCKPEKLHIVYCDAAINKVDEVGPEDYPFQLEGVGGGGTDMRVATQWVEDNVPDAACVVMLTDGYTPWPTSVSYPMFVATTAQEAPGALCESVKLTTN